MTQEMIAQLNQQLAETVIEAPLVLETERESGRLQNPDFRHGFAHSVLKNSYNQAFNFAYSHQIPVPAVGPAFRFLLSDGSEYMVVQWGVTHPEIQAEIQAEWSVDCD